MYKEQYEIVVCCANIWCWSKSGDAIPLSKYLSMTRQFHFHIRVLQLLCFHPHVLHNGMGCMSSFESCFWAPLFLLPLHLSKEIMLICVTVIFEKMEIFKVHVLVASGASSSVGTQCPVIETLICLHCACVCMCVHVCVCVCVCVCGLTVTTFFHTSVQMHDRT